LAWEDFHNYYDIQKKLSTYEFLKLSKKQKDLQERVMKIWEDLKLNCLITPGIASPAFKHGYSSDLLPSSIFPVFANVLNLPAGAVPITVVREDEQHYSKQNSTPYWDMFSKKMNDNMLKSGGLPVGVQVCTLPYEDEKCLSVMRQIEEEITFSKKYQCPI